jgi:hypothetical protein
MSSRFLPTGSGVGPIDRLMGWGFGRAVSLVSTHECLPFAERQTGTLGGYSLSTANALTPHTCCKILEHNPRPSGLASPNLVLLVLVTEYPTDDGSLVEHELGCVSPFRVCLDTGFRWIC